MKFALVDGLPREAERGLKGACQYDGHPMIPKCGDQKMHHWAHQAGHTCDPWWENETQWHRAWKNLFPVQWQEVIHKDEISGERHKADVKTDKGWVFEIQHSKISLEERQSREAFYGKLIWVVNGRRLERDLIQFHRVWMEGHLVNGNQSLRKLRIFECSLLREWANSTVPVFFDFGMGANIWWLLPKCSDGERDYVGVFTRNNLVQPHVNGMGQEIDEFAKFVQDFGSLASKYNAYLRVNRRQ